MKVGYLILGERRHGLGRYARLLAGEVERRPDVQVERADFALLGHPEEDLPRLAAAAEQLAAADVVHLQYNRAIWGDGSAQVRMLAAFLERCRAPIVATLHDVYPDDPWRSWKDPGGRLDSLLRGWRRRHQQRAVRLLLRRVVAALVCSETERARLNGFRDASRLRVIEHFVEERTLPERAAARNALGVADRAVVSVLGYIHPRKGYDLVVEAIPHLPEEVLVVFAGTATVDNEEKLKKLVKRAEKLGVQERLRVTGYLKEADQGRWLAATDLAVCPFRFFSASGSLSTWISAGRPILCHDLPQVAEYRQVAPDAFTTFAPYTPDALAGAIRAALAAAGDGPDPAIVRLAERFALPVIADRHLALYRDVAARPLAVRR